VDTASASTLDPARTFRQTDSGVHPSGMALQICLKTVFLPLSPDQGAGIIAKILMEPSGIYLPAGGRIKWTLRAGSN